MKCASRTFCSTVVSLVLAFTACGCRGLGSLAITEKGFFQNGDVQLHYAFDRPRTEGPFPVVVLGHGSGRITAQRNAGYAPRLLKHGIAVFRYDKRGVGRSGGEYSKAFSNLPVLALDMVAAVDFIKDHPQVDPTRIGLMGVSQAGWIIPIAAARSPDVRSTIILSGPTVTAMQANFFDAEADDPSLSMDALSERLRSFRTSPGDFDPRPHIEQMECPGLWIFGREDRIIPVRESAAILDKLIRAKNKPFKVITHPGLDHGLRSIESEKDSTTGPSFWPGSTKTSDRAVESKNEHSTSSHSAGNRQQ